MEKMERSNTDQHRVISLMIRLVAFIAISFAVTACVTTGSSDSNQVKKVVKKNCGPQSVSAVMTGDQPVNTTAETGAANSANPNNCLPKGVIEISENFGVAPEVRGEFNQAVMYLNQEKYAEAIKLLLAVSGKTSKFSAPYVNLGIAYSRTGELEKAEESFNKALEIIKQHPVASNELGLVYRKTGRYVEARKLYEELLAAYPDFLPARKNLGVLCDIYIQDLNCALEQYEEYLKGIPEDEKVKIWVADVKSRM